MGATEWSLLVALSVLWGGSFLFGEVALQDLRPLTVVLGRVGLAAVALLATVRLTGQTMPTSLKVWGAFLMMGALNNAIPFGLILWGQTQIAAGLPAILNATTPLFGIVLAHRLTTDERLTRRRLAGVLIGIAGVIVTIGPATLAGGDSAAATLGQVAVLGAACSYGVAGLFGRRFRGMPPLVLAAGQVTCSTALILSLAIVVDRPWTLNAPALETWGAVLGLALLCTALAYAIYFRLLATAGATNLLLVTMLIPVSALLLGAMLLDERVAARQVAGMAVIALGLATVDGRLMDRARRLGPRSDAPLAKPRDR